MPEEVDVNNLPPFPKRLPGKAETESFSRMAPPSPTFSLPPKISHYVRGIAAIGFCPHSPSELDQLREAYGSLNDVERNSMAQ